MLTDLKLYMVLLGSKAPGRHVEQHDFFFGVAESLKDLVPDMKSFWPEAGEKVHIDGWREVSAVDGYEVKVVPRLSASGSHTGKRLFFINLGGYQPNKFEEQHYVVVTVKDDRAAAFREAKDTLFYKENRFKGAESHIDDKYGIDVDDLYEIEEILPQAQKEKYTIELIEKPQLKEDQVNLGYLKLALLEKGKFQTE